MPLYEYQCKSCNNTFELRQKFSDAPASACPACGGEVEKLISQSGFALKGQGWYGDGYRLPVRRKLRRLPFGFLNQTQHAPGNGGFFCPFPGNPFTKSTNLLIISNLI